MTTLLKFLLFTSHFNVRPTTISEAEDCTLFLKANRKTILISLDAFSDASSRELSPIESSLFFVPKTLSANRRLVKYTQNIRTYSRTGKYLELPVIDGRVTKS